MSIALSHSAFVVQDASAVLMPSLLAEAHNLERSIAVELQIQLLQRLQLYQS